MRRPVHLLPVYDPQHRRALRHDDPIARSILEALHRLDVFDAEDGVLRLRVREVSVELVLASLLRAAGQGLCMLGVVRVLLLRQRHQRCGVEGRALVARREIVPHQVRLQAVAGIRAHRAVILAEVGDAFRPPFRLAFCVVHVRSFFDLSTLNTPSPHTFRWRGKGIKRRISVPGDDPGRGALGRLGVGGVADRSYTCGADGFHTEVVHAVALQSIEGVPVLGGEHQHFPISIHGRVT